MANVENMVGGSSTFFDGFRKADVCTKASFAFIKMAPHPSETLKVIVLLNQKELVYFKACQVMILVNQSVWTLRSFTYFLYEFLPVCLFRLSHNTIV